MENARPSANDLVNTTFGGMTRGEVAHRISAMILDNQATGKNRIIREIAAGTSHGLAVDRGGGVWAWGLVVLLVAGLLFLSQREAERRAAAGFGDRTAAIAPNA